MKLDSVHAKVARLEEQIGLRAFYGLKNFSETLPLLWVMGQQRSGKSSFIKMITGVLSEDDDRFVVSVPMGCDVAEFAAIAGKIVIKEVHDKRDHDMMVVESPKRLAYEDASSNAWFAERADLIFIFFDAAYLDVDDELKRTIESLKEFKSKVRLVLNKGDRLGTQQLVKAYGVLMWTFSSIWKGSDPPRAFVGCFNSEHIALEEHKVWFALELSDLYKGKR